MNTWRSVSVLSLGRLFQLAGQLKQFVPIRPVSAAHKTLTFRLKQEDFQIFLFQLQVAIKNGLIMSATSSGHGPDCCVISQGWHRHPGHTPIPAAGRDSLALFPGGGRTAVPFVAGAAKLHGPQPAGQPRDEPQLCKPASGGLSQ